MLVQSYNTAPTEAATQRDLYLYHNDPNGCPTRLLDATGRVVWAAQYSAWGKVERLYVNTVNNPIRLQAQYEDDETHLHYNRYRYYDPTIGGFASQDPMSLAAGDNVYEYGANTTGWIDPFGLKPCNITRKAKKALVAAPLGMLNPHMHHIVMEGAFTHWTRASRKLVTQARTLLRKHRISLQGVE